MRLQFQKSDSLHQVRWWHKRRHIFLPPGHIRRQQKKRPAHCSWNDFWYWDSSQWNLPDGRSWFPDIRRNHESLFSEEIPQYNLLLSFGLPFFISSIFPLSFSASHFRFSPAHPQKYAAVPRPEQKPHPFPCSSPLPLYTGQTSSQEPDSLYSYIN